jgi:hypothetical protein
MNDESRQELISAYLDDELSPEERARVEAWLSENSELRQLHDELLALRAGLQSLPTHKLDRDLAAEVLRRAEQGASRTNDDKVQRAAALMPEGDIPSGTSWWDRGSNLRRVIWPVLAVAAALLVLVYDAQQRPEEQQVALAPEQEVEAPASEPVEPAELSSDEATQRDEPAAAGGTRAMGRQSDLELGYQPRSATRAGSELLDRSAAGQAEPPSAGRRMPAGAMSAKSMAEATDETPTLVFTCSPQYLRENNFEKLLKAEKVEWKRENGPSTNAFAQSDRTAPALAPADQRKESAAAALPDPLQATYFLRGSGEQVSQVLSQLPQQASGSNVQVTPLYKLQQQKLAEARNNKAEQNVRIMLVAPREPNQAAPAQSAPIQAPAKKPTR